MNNSFYSIEELGVLGFKNIGKNCLISKKASFYDVGSISIGNHVRIDDFCILSGDIAIGDYVHISAYCALYGSKGIVIGNYSGLSPRTTIFSAVDDFSGDYLINPMVGKEYTNVTGGKVIIGNYTQIGANSIIMPDLHINEGTVTGAFTFINSSLNSWGIYVGIPAKRIKDRKKNLLKFTK